MLKQGLIDEASEFLKGNLNYDPAQNEVIRIQLVFQKFLELSSNDFASGIKYIQGQQLHGLYVLALDPKSIKDHFYDEVLFEVALSELL